MISRRAFWAALAVLIVAVASLWALPRLPGRVRQYLPEPLAGLGAPPLPAALPAPTGVPALSDLTAVAELALLAPPTPFVTAAAPATAAPPGLALPTPTLAPTPSPSPTSPPLPPFVRIDGVPIIPQKFNNCGPTNLTLVLNHYGVTVDQFDVAAVVRPNYEDRNVSPDELAAYVNDMTGLSAAAYVGGDIDLLRRLLAAGFPVIIEKGLEPDATIGWMGHYLTVYGYDDEMQRLYARDTYLGPWEGDGLLSYAGTAHSWAQFNGTFVVVHAPERAAELARLLGPAYGDAQTMWLTAAEKARAAIVARPADPFAWFNLGTSLTALAGYDPTQAEAAAVAFDQARLLGLPPRMLWYQFAPYDAYLAVGRTNDVLDLVTTTFAGQGGRNVEETYLYQGLALRAQGDEDGARIAFQQAAELNPGSPVGLAALAALGGS